MLAPDRFSTVTRVTLIVSALALTSAALAGAALARLPVGDRPDGSVLQSLTTQRGAKTLALDSASRRIDTVTADFGPTPAASEAQPRPRPPILPNTARGLVLKVSR